MKKFMLLLTFLLLVGCTSPPPDTLDSRKATFEECNEVSREYEMRAQSSWNILRANNYWLRAIYWKINARRMQNESMDKTLNAFMKEFREHIKDSTEQKKGNHAR
jgi:hypothetical protein